MMPTVSSVEAIRCTCGGTVEAASGRDRVKCVRCGSEFPMPPPAPAPCRFCGNEAVVLFGPVTRCSQCGKNQ